MSGYEEIALWLGAGAAGNSWLKRLFGPSVDVIAERLAELTEERVQNLGEVVKAADRKSEILGLPADSVPSLRVAGNLFGPASYASQAIVADHFGGVLASARTAADGEDDRGVPWMAQINRMSSDEIRAHYVLYEMLRRQMVRRHPNDAGPLQSASVLKQHSLVVPTAAFADFTEEFEFVDTNEAMSWVVERGQAALLGLHREGLIEEWFNGPFAALPASHKPEGEHPFPGHPTVTAFTPNMVGVRLFLVAHGYGRHHSGTFASTEWQTDLMELAGFHVPDEGDESVFARAECCHHLLDLEGSP